jgi:uncharacterized protein (TIGR03086 family)
MSDPSLLAHNLVDQHGRSGQRLAALVDGVRPEQWHDDTPCSEWDVRTLTHHLLYEQRWVPSLCAGETIQEIGGRFDGDLMGGDTTAWPNLLAFSIAEAHAAVARPGVLDRTVHLSFGEASGLEYVTQLTVDLAIHGWDLARATGQNDAMDPGAVALMLAWAEPNAELISKSGFFGARIDVPPGAPDYVRLLGLLGRRA